MRIEADNIVLFPIDTVARELEWQVVLALESLKYFGNTSIIGHKDFITQIHKSSENCVWFGRLGTNHGTSKKDISILNTGNQNNSTFLYLHDEGGFYPYKNYKSSLLQCHPVETAQIAKKFEFLVWGKSQQQILLEENGALGKSIITSGMPRFDLYKKEWDWLDKGSTQRIKDQYGSFTLVITKFGNANSSEHRAGLISESFLKANKLIDDEEKIADFFERWEKDQLDFSAFVKMLRYVFKAFPQRHFVIRPHPSEDSEFYRQVFGSYPNVEIVRQGDIRPWIKACEAMIHTGCTTGLEGVLANKKVINYIPGNKKSPYDIAIAYEAGKLANKPEEVIGYLNEPCDANNQKVSEDAKNKLYNLNANSFPVIMQRLNEYFKVRPSSSIQLDSVAFRELKFLKDKFKKNSIAQRRKLNSKETGRNVRLSNLPIRRIKEVVSKYNKKYDTNCYIKSFSRTHVVVAPG